MREDRVVEHSVALAGVAIAAAVAIAWLAGAPILLGLHFCADVGTAALTTALLLGMIGFRGPWPWQLACTVGGAITVPVWASLALLYEMIAERLSWDYPLATWYSGNDVYAGHWWHSDAFLLGPSYAGLAVFLVGAAGLGWEIWRHVGPRA